MPTFAIPDIPAGSNVLLDANVLILAITGRSTQCVELLARCDKESITGVTTVEAINEACHRFMLAEAFSKGLITKANASSLKGKANILAAAMELGIDRLATNDSDFDTVSSLTIYKPTDVP